MRLVEIDVGTDVERPHEPFGCFRNKRRLVREVPVHRAARDTRAHGNVLQCGCRHAVFGESGKRRLHDPQACEPCVNLRVPDHAVCSCKRPGAAPVAPGQEALTEGFAAWGVSVAATQPPPSVL